jgi:2-phosphosulfolactate phosphatase
VRVDVAFTAEGASRVSTGIVVDVLRATSTIVQALEGGYRSVFCCAEVEDARALRDELGGVLAGERRGVDLEGFDLGNSPRDFAEARAETLVLTTTNGTRAILTAARTCDVVLVGALLNAGSVAQAARELGEDVVIVCAGVEGRFTLDDAYCAGRIAALLGGARSDAAEAAVRLAGSFATAEEALAASENPHRDRIEADIPWCARESVFSVVPRFVGMHGPAAKVEKS